MSGSRPAHLALLLALLALSLVLRAAPAASAPAAGPDSARGSAPGSTAVSAPPAAARRPRVFAATDSARRAYRAWLRHLRARAFADSLARADSSARADSLARAAAARPPDYLAEVRANFTPVNRAYATTKAILGFLEPLGGMLVGLFILFSGLSARIRDVAHGLGYRAYVRGLVYFALCSLVVFVLGFPLAFYRDFALEHHYGLSTQGFGPWLGEQFVWLAVGIVTLSLVPLVQLAYAAIRRFPRGWWLVLGLGTLPVMLVGSLLQPVLVDPLVNRFTPLQDRELESRILAVARKAGIPARHVFQVDRSRQTRTYEAYVSGFGPSQRIVLYDTTLRGMKPDEILFAVGHEAAHYRLHHVWWGILFASLLSFVFFGLCAVTAGWAVRRWGRRWGFTELHDFASLPLFFVAVNLLSLLAMPAVNSFSRRIEHEADVYGLEVTHLNDAAARAFIKLGSQNRTDPDPPAFVEFFEYSHPPLLERVRLALSYRPWERGKPNRLFRPAR